MVDSQIRPSDVTKFPIIKAMLEIPREEFVPDRFREFAYAGHHIELAYGRVLLEPRTFAKLLDALDIRPDELVLDVGSGLGYSAAVIARMAEAVVALEELHGFAQQAETKLSRHSIDNAIAEQGILIWGAPLHGPYDVIVVEGAVGQVPELLIDQLKTGGRIATIFSDGITGQCCIGIKQATSISWRPIFSAVAPVMPGFQQRQEFVF